MEWRWRKFPELTTSELYALLQLRARVFVVEQNCVYLDPDGIDEKSFHLLGFDGGKLCAYARVLPPALKYPEASIGRVATAPEARGTGAGRALMAEAIARGARVLGASAFRISAQAHLERFYESFGFRRVGENYLEDNIPHCEMLRPSRPAAL